MLYFSEVQVLGDQFARAASGLEEYFSPASPQYSFLTELGHGIMARNKSSQKNCLLVLCCFSNCRVLMEKYIVRPYVPSYKMKSWLGNKKHQLFYVYDTCPAEVYYQEQLRLQFCVFPCCFELLCVDHAPVSQVITR